MRTAELHGRMVVDLGGRELGRVKDFRLVQDGPVQLPSGEPAYRLAGFIVGGTVVPSALGYGRTVQGPGLLTWIFGRLARRERLVRWSDVASLDEHGRMRLRVPVESLPSLLDVSRGGEGT